MPGLMQWRSANPYGTGSKVLFVQDPGHPWRHHKASLHYTPDQGLTFGGIATQIACRDRGYTLLPSNQALPAVELQALQMDEPEMPKLMPLSSLSEDQRQRWSA